MHGMRRKAMKRTRENKTMRGLPHTCVRLERSPHVRLARNPRYPKTGITCREGRLNGRLEKSFFFPFSLAPLICSWFHFISFYSILILSARAARTARET
jgi:hypothetical protein